MNSFLGTYNHLHDASLATNKGNSSDTSGHSIGDFQRGPYPGLDKVLKEMKRLVNQAKGDPIIREKTVRITDSIKKHPSTGLPDRRDFDAIAQALYEWGNKNIAYLRDPNNIEWLQTPQKTLERKYGDCDDHSILFAAMLESVGIPTRFKIISVDKQNPDQFSHVYLQYQSQDETWKDFDTTLHQFAGVAVPEPYITNSKIITLEGLKTMRTIYIQPLNGVQLGVDPVTVGTAVGAGSQALNAIKNMFGANESPADKSKQQIQQHLAEMGYTQFSKMGGWSGDEQAKDLAMKKILAAVTQFPNSVTQITGWLDEGGNITPETIRKIEENYAINLNLKGTPPAVSGSGSGSGSSNGSGTGTQSGGSNKTAVSKASMTWIGGGLLLLAAGGMWWQSRNN